MPFFLCFFPFHDRYWSPWKPPLKHWCEEMLRSSTDCTWSTVRVLLCIRPCTHRHIHSGFACFHDVGKTTQTWSHVEERKASVIHRSPAHSQTQTRLLLSSDLACLLAVGPIFPLQKKKVYIWAVKFLSPLAVSVSVSVWTKARSIIREAPAAQVSSEYFIKTWAGLQQHSQSLIIIYLSKVSVLLISFAWKRKCKSALDLH